MKKKIPCRIYLYLLLGMVIQEVLAIVAEAVTYHVSLWAGCAGFIIACSVLLGLRIALKNGGSNGANN